MVDAGLRAVALAAVCLGLGPACSGPGPAGAFIDSVRMRKRRPSPGGTLRIA